MNTTARRIGLVVALVAIGVALYFLSPKNPSGSMGTPATVTPNTAIANRSDIIAQKSKQYSLAPELASPTGLINTSGIKLSELVGKKVVLVDFWTYSCINCLRT